MMSNNSCLWLIKFRRLPGRSDTYNKDRKSSMLTAPIIPTRIAGNCVDVGFSLGLRAVEPNMAAGWGSTAGWSNEPYRGYTAFVGSACERIGVPKFTRRLYPWPHP